jgi:hypothetical protein
LIIGDNYLNWIKGELEQLSIGMQKIIFFKNVKLLLKSNSNKINLFSGFNYRFL